MVEIVAVLVIIGILAAFVAPHFINMASEAKQRTAYAGIAEYNTREKLLWSKILITHGFSILTDAELDDSLYNQMDFNLNGGDGTDWAYIAGSGSAGSIRAATLQFKGEEIAISRIPATRDTPARWSRTGSADAGDLVTLHSGSFTDTNWDDVPNYKNWAVTEDGAITTDGPNVLLLKGYEVTDFEATVTATLVSGNGWGFFYRATPNEDAKQKVDGYTFQLDPGAGDRFLVKDAATDKTIASVKIKDIFGTSFDMNAEHTFSIDVVGDQHTIVVDGKTALSFTDDRYESGQTGFRTWGGEAEFSDLELIAK